MNDAKSFNKLQDSKKYGEICNPYDKVLKRSSLKSPFRTFVVNYNSLNHKVSKSTVKLLGTN